MKSSMMMFTFAASLSMGVLACQMPVDDEGLEPEQSQELASALDSESDAVCAARIRGEGTIAEHERSLVLTFVDPCHEGDVQTVYLSSVDEKLLFDGAVLGGELVLPDNTLVYVSGSIEKINGKQELQLYALESESSLIASVHGQLAQSGANGDVRLTATAYWY